MKKWSSWLGLVVFAQVIMLYGSQHYISLFDRSRKNTGVTGTSKHHSFRKRSSRLERGKHMPLYFVLTGYLKLREKRLIVLKESAREIGFFISLVDILWS